MLANSGATTPSPASTSDCTQRAMRPLPSLKGWISTRFRWAIAARTIGHPPVPLAWSTISATSRSTSSRGGAS